MLRGLETPPLDSYPECGVRAGRVVGHITATVHRERSIP